MVTPGQKGRIGVTVVALADGASFHKQMLVPVGQTVGFAVQASGVRAALPAFAGAEIGVFGRKVAPEQLLADGDRVELCLPCDPAAVKKVRQRTREKRGSNRSGREAAETAAENNCPLPKATLPG